MKYTFLEALALVVGTETKINYNECPFWISYDGRDLRDNYKNTVKWPTIEQQKEQKWEIAPEEIYLYGACDDDGESCLYLNKPSKKDIVWDFTSDHEEEIITLSQNNLFLKNKPQKFKLVLVED